MKRVILLSIVIVLGVVTLGYANNTDTRKEKKETEKSNLIETKSEEKPKEILSRKSIIATEPIDTSENSMYKLNYLFYFIYKFRFQANSPLEEEMNALFQD